MGMQRLDHIKETEVRFRVSAPFSDMDSNELESSPELHALLEQWQRIRNVIGVKFAGVLAKGNGTKVVELCVRIQGKTAKARYRLYNKLTRETSVPPFSTISRRCDLHDMTEE